MSTTKVFGLDLGFKFEQRLTRWAGILVGEVMVIILATAFLLVPQISKIQAEIETLSKNQTLLANLQKKLSLLDDFSVSFAGKDVVMGNVFLADKDPGLTLSSLRQVANKAGMTMTSFKIAPEVLTGQKTTVAKKGPQSVKLDLTVAGPSTSVDAFLKLMNESLPLKTVDSLEIAQDPVLVNQLDLKMTVSVYVADATVNVSTLGLIQPFSEANTALFNQVTGYFSAVTTAQPAVTLGNPNLFGL